MNRLPQRPESHALATEAINYVKALIPSAWNTIEYPTQNDYGIDLRVEVFTLHAPTGDEFNVQVKARRTKKSQQFSIPWESKNILYLLQNKMPSLLTLYHAPTKRVYGRWVHDIAHLLHERAVSRKIHRKLSVTFGEDQLLQESSIESVVSRGFYGFRTDPVGRALHLCIEPGAIPLLLRLEDCPIEITPENLRDINAVNALIEQDAVIVMKEEVTGDWGFERWRLCLAPSWHGKMAVDYYRRNALWLDKVIENARMAWACAG